MLAASRIFGILGIPCVPDGMSAAWQAGPPIPVCVPLASKAWGRCHSHTHARPDDLLSASGDGGSLGGHVFAVIDVGFQQAGSSRLSSGLAGPPGPKHYLSPGCVW